ncbi:MAG: DUF4215 domain-containing protein [Myxococcota bacterium]
MGRGRIRTVLGAFVLGTLPGLVGCTWIPLGVCGNGLVEDDEACDDGNDRNRDACTNACEEAFCGDGYLWDQVEQCDDGELNGETGACGLDCLINEDPG